MFANVGRYSILIQIFFQYCHFSIDGLILIILFSPSLNFLHSHFIFSCSIFTKPSFYVVLHSSFIPVRLSLLLSFLLQVCLSALAKILYCLFILSIVSLAVVLHSHPFTKNIYSKTSSSDQLKQYIDRVNVTSVLLQSPLTFPLNTPFSLDLPLIQCSPPTLLELFFHVFRLAVV